jgi:hypothetical protein
VVHLQSRVPAKVWVDLVLTVDVIHIQLPQSVVAQVMLKGVAIAWWAMGVIIFAIIVLNGGWAGWVGFLLCIVLLILSIMDWGHSEDPNDWSV